MSNRYDLYATLTECAGRRLLAALGRQERCERVARHLAERGLPATVQRVGRVTVIDRGRPEQALGPGELPRAA